MMAWNIRVSLMPGQYNPVYCLIKLVNSMRTESKYRLMLGLTVACLLGLAAQTVYLLNLQDRLAGPGQPQDERVQSIEDKILANLDATEPDDANWDPFGWSTRSTADPFAMLQQMQADMDALFGSFGMGPAFPQPRLGRMQSGLTNPAIEVHETPGEYQIVIPVTPDTEVNLNTSLEDNALTIEGTLKRQSLNQHNRFSASTLSQSQFSRTIELPAPVDELGMSTSQSEDGIVILVPKKTA